MKTKHVQRVRYQKKTSVSQAALARARNALSVVAYSTEKMQHISKAAENLPNVAVMIGHKAISVQSSNT